MGIILRVLHTIPAILVAGGAAYLLFALHPALAAADEGGRAEIRERAAARWSMVVWVSIALLLISGLANFLLYRLPLLRGADNAGLYHGLFGLKFLLALLAFHAAAMLSLPGEKGKRHRANAGGWLKYLVVLLALVVILGALLRSLAEAQMAA